MYENASKTRYCLHRSKAWTAKARSKGVCIRCESPEGEVACRRATCATLHTHSFRNELHALSRFFQLSDVVELNTRPFR